MQKTINVIALTIAIIGAINWGLIGFFNFNLVSYLFGSASMLSKVIYALVGICGLYLIGFYGPVTQEKISTTGLAGGLLCTIRACYRH